MRIQLPLGVLCAAVLAAAGCASKQIVRAAPPSVTAPLPEEPPPAPPPATPPPTVATPTPAAAPEPAALAPAPPKRPTTPHPRPAPTEAAEPAPPKPAPPEISPELSPRDLENAKASTAQNITTAEKNLHEADGKQLNAAQKDLTDKISGFLNEAHEAIRSDDWVRALNLAEKARVLSAELVKSL